MKEYVISVVTVSVIAMIAEVIIPEGKMKKYASFAISVILSLCIIQPLFQIEIKIPGKLEAKQTTIDFESAVESTVHSVSGYENANVSVKSDGGKVSEIKISVFDEKLAEKAKAEVTKEYLKSFLSAVYGTENIYIGDE